MNKDLFIHDPELRNALLPFQRQSVRRAALWNWRILIADVMGLGKTMQALACLRLNPEMRPAVIVCKAIGKPNWKKHAHKWLRNDEIYVVNGFPSPENIYQAFVHDVVIINYDILANDSTDLTIVRPGKKDKVEVQEIRGTGWVDFLRLLGPRAIIIDEAQYIINKKAQRTKAILDLCLDVQHIIALSGTGGIKKKPIQGWNLFNLLDPMTFNSYYGYAKRFCGAVKTAFGWDMSGATNTEQLNKILTSTIMIRRTKKDVYTELPAKRREIIPLPYDIKEYYKTMIEFERWLDQSEGVNPAAGMYEIEKIKQACVRAKMKSVLEWISDFLASDDEIKLIVFAVHIDVVDKIYTHFKHMAVKVNGEVSPKEKQAAQDRFQTDPACRLIVLNIQSGGDTWDLTAANDTAFVEFPWNPDELEQAEDRNYMRLNDPHGANIWFLVAEETYEEDLIEVLAMGLKVLEQILDGKKVDHINVLEELLKRLRERRIKQ